MEGPEITQAFLDAVLEEMDLPDKLNVKLTLESDGMGAEDSVVLLTSDAALRAVYQLGVRDIQESRIPAMPLAFMLARAVRRIEDELRRTVEELERWRDSSSL